MLNVKINHQENNQSNNNYLNYSNQTGCQQSPISSLSSLVFGKPPGTALVKDNSDSLLSGGIGDTKLFHSQLLENQQQQQQTHPPIICQKVGSKNLFTSEFQINDVPIFARNLLTKGQIHDEIAQYSGATVSTRGRYISPVEKSRGSDIQTRSLYLYIQGSEQQSVSLAIQRINKIIANDPQNNSNTTSTRMTKYNNNRQLTTSTSVYNMAPQPNTISIANNNNTNLNQLSQPQQQQSFIEKMQIGLDHAPPAFNLREQIIGAGGANLQYIRNETGAIATLRGRGSLFIDSTIGSENPEPLYLYIEHQHFEGLQAAKQLAKNLIETLQHELVHFQQLNQNQITFPNGTTILQSQQQQPPPSQSLTTQINIPPPSILTIPPPTVMHQQQNQQVDQQNAMVHSSFLQQQTLSIPPPQQTSTQPQTAPQAPTIIHQQIMPQTAVPIQLQHGNVVIQPQQTAGQTTIGNVNVPPPSISIPIKTGQLLQFQSTQQQGGQQLVAQQPITAQLAHPPPNIQLQQTAPTQILLNPPQNQQYQYQYIQQPLQTAEQLQSNQQVTIQHIYQPQQQQIQGIQVQQTTVPTVQQSSQTNFEQQYQQIRTAPQFHTSVSAPVQPQYITVQGSTAYMVPPPTIIHQQVAQTQQLSAPANPSVIFQQHQQQIQQVQMQQTPLTIQNTQQPPPVLPQQQIQRVAPSSSQEHCNDGSTDPMTTENAVVEDKDDCKSENEDDNSPTRAKTPDDNKSDNDTQENDESSEAVPVTATTNQITASTTANNQENIQINHQQLSATQISPTISQQSTMVAAVQPPISCVQHFVGNTLITTHPVAQTHTNQIYTQVPVSIQQIQQQINQGQQCVVSTANGQHFVVSAAPQQWQQTTTAPQITQQVQQLQPNGAIQNLQITHQQISTQPTNIGDFRTLPPQHQTGQLSATATATIPQQHQIGATAVATSQNGQQQMQVSFNQQHVQLQLQPQLMQQLPQQHQIIDQTQLIGQQITIPQQQAQLISHQQQQFNIIRPPPNIENYGMPPVLAVTDQTRMIGQKRKLNDDEIGSQNNIPRLGMGPRDQIQQQQQQQQQQHRIQTQLMGLTSQPPPPPPPPPTLQQSSQTGPSNIGQDDLNGQKSRTDNQQLLNQSTEQRQYYQRDESFILDGGPSSSLRHSNQIQQQRQLISSGGGNGVPARGPRFQMNNNLMNVGGGSQLNYHPLRYNSMQLQSQECVNNNNIANSNYQMNRMNMCPNGINLPPQLQQQYLRPQQQFRGDCPPPNMNMGNNNYGPPPSRFRGQW